jgi:ribosome-binding protein aMBF1 (putative translation factor)
MAKRGTTVAGALTIGGVEYVVIPKAEYLRLQDLHPGGAVDAHAFIRGSIAEDLRAAREAAGLTQAELADRMGKSQTMVSQAESGAARVSERYVRAVLEACGLPEGWKPGKARGKRAKRAGEGK